MSLLLAHLHDAYLNSCSALQPGKTATATKLHTITLYTNSPYHVTGSARTAVGRFQLLARLSGGTHCPKTSGIRSVVLTVTDSR